MPVNVRIAPQQHIIPFSLCESRRRKRALQNPLITCHKQQPARRCVSNSGGLGPVSRLAAPGRAAMPSSAS